MNAGAFTVSGSGFRVSGMKVCDRRFPRSSFTVRWWGGLYARHSDGGLHGGRKARPTIG